jgi:hypothetical protein
MSLRTPSSAPSAKPAHDASAPEPLIAVDRVLADLRRGRLIVVVDSDGALLVQAAEAVTPQSLARLAELGQAPVMLALTERRADALGLAGPKDAKVVALEIADGTPTSPIPPPTSVSVCRRCIDCPPISPPAPKPPCI